MSAVATHSTGKGCKTFQTTNSYIASVLRAAQGMPRTIIGIIPASFRLHVFNFQTAEGYEAVGEETDPAFYLRDSYWGMDAIGLLKPGVTLEQAQDDMKRVNAGLDELKKSELVDTKHVAAIGYCFGGMAAIEALSALKEPCEVEFFTDSEYVKNGVTKWIWGWQKNGWRPRGRPAIATDLVRQPLRSEWRSRR